MAQNLYKTAKWQRLRAAVMKRDGYKCQWSKRYGKTVEATTVHHIFPANDYPEYALAAWNLISLSNKGHEAMHDRQTGLLSDEGKRLLERTALKRGIKL